MSRHDADVPDLVPQLSRGKHRRPRQGACFMEFASYLAGERWSDHPACTHPLLATLARLVNDHTSDAARGRLVELVPSVIGLTSDDPHVDVELALRAATTALPVAGAERQRVLAVSVLAAERVRADLDGRSVAELGERSEWALAQVPHATAWARRFAQGMRTTPGDFVRRGAPNTVAHAVVGIAQACVPDPDEMLHDLLTGAIADCAARFGGDGDRAGRLTSPAAATRPSGTTDAPPRTVGRRQGRHWHETRL
jgi:hypothetical protein